MNNGDKTRDLIDPFGRSGIEVNGKFYNVRDVANDRALGNAIDGQDIYKLPSGEFVNKLNDKNYSDIKAANTVAGTKVSLNEKTGAVKITAPQEFLSSTQYKENWAPKLESLSKIYRQNPDMATTLDLQTTDEDGKTVTETKSIKDYIEQLNNIDNGIPTAAKNFAEFMAAARAASKQELGLSDEEVDAGKGYNEYSYMLRIQMVGKGIFKDDPYDTALQVLPIGDNWEKVIRDMAERAGVSGEINKNANGELTITRKGLRAIYNRNDADKTGMTREDVTALKDMLQEHADKALEKKDYDEVARTNALIQTLRSEDPDVGFWDGLWDQIQAGFGGLNEQVVKDMESGETAARATTAIGFSAGFIAGAKIGGGVGTVAGPVGTAAGGVIGGLLGLALGGLAKEGYSQVIDIPEIQKTADGVISELVKGNNDILNSNKNAALAYNAGKATPDVAFLIASIAAGNAYESAVKGAAAAIRTTRFMKAVDALAKGGVVADGAAKSLKGTYAILKAMPVKQMAQVANVVFSVGVKATSLAAETLGEVIISSPDLMNKLFASEDLSDEARAKLAEEFMWNVGGWATFSGVSAVTKEFATTKIGRILNAYWTKLNFSISSKAADIQNAIRKFTGTDIEATNKKLGELKSRKKLGAISNNLEDVTSNKIAKLEQRQQELLFRKLINEAKKEVVSAKGWEAIEDAKINAFMKAQNVIQDMITKGKIFTSEFIASKYGKSFIQATKDSGELIDALKKFDPSFNAFKSIEGVGDTNIVISFGKDVDNYLSMVSNTQKLAKMELAGVEGSAIQVQLEHELAKMAEFKTKYGEEVTEAADKLVGSIQKATADFYDYGIAKNIFNKKQIQELRDTGLWGPGGEGYMALARVDDPIDYVHNKVRDELRNTAIKSGDELEKAMFGTIDKDYLNPLQVLYTDIVNTSGYIAKNQMTDMMSKLGILRDSDIAMSAGDTEKARRYKNLISETDRTLEKAIKSAAFDNDGEELNKVADSVIGDQMKLANKQIEADKQYRSIHKEQDGKTVVKAPKVKVDSTDISDTVIALGPDFDEVCMKELNATFEPEEVYDMLIDFQKNGGDIETTLLDETYSPIQELISESDGSKRAFNQFYKNLSSEQQEELARRIQTRGEGMQQEVLSKKDYIAQSDAQKTLDGIQDTVKNTPVKIKELDGNISKIEGQIAEESKKIVQTPKATKAPKGLSADEKKTLEDAKSTLKEYRKKLDDFNAKNKNRTSLTKKEKDSRAAYKLKIEVSQEKIDELIKKAGLLEAFTQGKTVEVSKAAKKEAEAAKKKVAELKSKLNDLKKERKSLDKDLAKAKKNLAAAKEKVKTVGAGYNNYVNKLTKENAKAMEVSYGNVIGLTQNAKGAKNALKVKSLDKAIGDSSRRVSVETFAERYANMTPAQKEIMQRDIRKTYGEKLKKTEYIKERAKQRKQAGQIILTFDRTKKTASEVNELSNKIFGKFSENGSEEVVNSCDEIVDNLVERVTNDELYGGSGNAKKLYTELAGSEDNAKNAVLVHFNNYKMKVGDKSLSAKKVITDKTRTAVQKNFRKFAENQYAIDSKAAKEAGKVLEYTKDDYLRAADDMTDEYMEAFALRLDTRIANARTALQDSGSLAAGSDDLFDEAESLTKEIESMEKSRRKFVVSGDGEGYVRRLIDNGEAVYYKTSPAIANILNNTPSVHQDNIVDLINKVQSSIYRAGTTGLYPGSYVNQGIKDTGTTFAMGGVTDFARIINPNIALDSAKMLLDDDTSKIWKTYSKGDDFIEGMTGKEAAEMDYRAYKGVVSGETEAAQYNFAKAKRDQRLLQSGIYGNEGDIDSIYTKGSNAVSKVNQKMQTAHQLREETLRMSTWTNAYEQAIKSGKTRQEANIIARFLADNGNTNFNRALLHFNNYASTVPYLKSAINGTKSFWRLFEIDPIGVTTRIMTGFVAPTMFFTINNLGSEENRNIYKNIPDYIKQGSLVIIQDGEVITIPLPEQIAALMNPIRHTIEAMQGSAPDSFSMMMANDIVGMLPVDFTGFTSLDISKVQPDGTQLDDRLNLGWMRLASGTMPVLVKSAFMAATGVDPYTGKNIKREDGYLDEDGQWVVMDSSTGELANVLAGALNQIGVKTSANMMQKLGEGTFGRAIYGIVDSVAELGRAVQDSQANPDMIGSIIDRAGEKTIGKLVKDVTNPLTYEAYDLASSQYRAEVAKLRDEKEALLNSNQMQKIVKAMSNETDQAKLANLRAQRDSLVNDFNQKVLNMVNSFREAYPDQPFSYAKFGSAVQLMNMNQNATAQSIYQESALASSLSDEEKRLYKARAYDTMIRMGFPSFEGPELFGQLQRTYNKATGRYDGDVEVVWRDPLAILDYDSTKNLQEDIHRANIESIAKYSGWSAKKAAYKEQKDAIYNSKTKLKSEDYDRIDQIQAQENADYMKDIAKYINAVTPEAVLSNEEVLNFLDGYIKPLSSTVGYVKNTTNIKGSKTGAFAANYIKAIYKMNDTGYNGASGDWSGRGQWWKQ